MSIAALAFLICVLSLSLYALNHTDPVTTLLAFCKLRIYVLQCLSLTYRWCLTAACFDRFALSSNDLHMRNFARVQIARRTVCIIVVVCTIAPVHTLIFYNLRGRVCGIVYSSAAALYHSVFSTLAFAVLPVAIMFACARLTYRNLVLQRRRQQVLVGQRSSSLSNSDEEKNKQNQQVLRMLLAQTLFYAVTIAPLMCIYIYNAITFQVTNKSADRMAIEQFCQFLAELINILFAVSSFYLYTLVSRMFRREILNMFRSVLTRVCQPKNFRRVTPVIHDIQLATVPTQN
ncbi:unnamed protein product [Adineta ricciae]|uniref:G-protein coupled receptors family 1 profile domain-containing protein n=1 Tax=Adineta ricciae TaxID=249248 RepID=A0A814V503_ADIRI|nr:unnamed protein product [Adineta ricciae]